MKNYSDYTDLIDEAIEKNIDPVWDLNLYMASHPELGGQEYEASRRMKDMLE